MGNSNINQDDIYTISPGVYKTTSIYGRSTDSKGHLVHRRINFPPAVVNAINAMYPKLGYQTLESFVRDAVVHRLHFWQQQPDFPPEISGLLALAESQAVVEEEERTQRDIEDLRKWLSNSNGSTRPFLVTKAMVYRDSLPDYLSHYREDLDRLIKTYERD